MSEPCSSKSTPTILDYLNEDCWRAILEYVPVKDIIRSERVCSQWQWVVLEYLRGLRIGIEHPYPSLGSNELHRSVSWLLVRHQKPLSLQLWTNKLGPSVVSAYCDTEESFKIIGENCPNLEAVKFMNLPDQLLINNRTEHFKWLQRICFIKCNVSDECVGEYATSYALEELEVHHNHVFTGEYLSKINPELKSLVLNQCRALRFSTLRLALDKLRNLTKLVLNLCSMFFYNYSVMYENHMWDSLSYLSKLKHLVIKGMNKTALIEAVCKLKNLKHLGGDTIYTDQELETISKSCTKLESLEFAVGYYPPAEGLRIMCQNIRLRALGFRNAPDHFILTCAAVCPDLVRLHIGTRNHIPESLIARVSEVRRSLSVSRPLHLYIDSEVLDLTKHGTPNMDQYKEVVLHY